MISVAFSGQDLKVAKLVLAHLIETGDKEEQATASQELDRIFSDAELAEHGGSFVAIENGSGIGIFWDCQFSNGEELTIWKT